MSVRPDQVQEAVRHFWATRQRQSALQGGGKIGGKGGNRAKAKDRGARSAVTAGKQMDAFITLVRDLLVGAGVPGESVRTGSRLELPGWFRAEKQWDLVVVHREHLLAAVEFKSQVGPSFGNNFNNRTEESLGSATDIWAAYREGAFKPSLRPWLGYFMLLEDCEASRRPVGVAQPSFPVFA
ncbi:MAG: PaeR7I family type II restriction endonuclease, partial [Phycisphaeraceae bacterium]|nr:PaeR7I family type II restriction endonuclease [Phycisphaeraceae bacterium]